MGHNYKHLVLQKGNLCDHCNKMTIKHKLLCGLYIDMVFV